MEKGWAPSASLSRKCANCARKQDSAMCGGFQWRIPSTSFTRLRCSGVTRLFLKSVSSTNQTKRNEREETKMYGTVGHYRVKPGMEGQLVEQVRVFEAASVPGTVATYCIITQPFRQGQDVVHRSSQNEHKYVQPTALPRAIHRVRQYASSHAPISAQWD